MSKGAIHNDTKKKGRATLAEVAKRAGVSSTTASLVLRGQTQRLRISEDTDRRVREAARECDYSPNLLVHSLQQGKTQVISFFNAFRHRDASDLYMDRLSTAIERASGDVGYDVLIHCDFSRSPEDLYRFINGGRADGLLFFAPLPNDPLLPWFRKSRLPVVTLGSKDPTGELPSVRDDVDSGMRLVAEALLSRGHRRIAIVKEQGSDYRDADQRADLLCKYLGLEGVEVPDSQIFIRDGDANETLKQILDQKNPPTAIFCWRDLLAYSMLEACHEQGIQVPEQLSVVGYDGLHWPAATSHVAASVHIDLRSLADSAVALLNSYIAGHVEESRHLVVPVTFQIGTTLGTAP